jgi:hypothetical protein
LQLVSRNEADGCIVLSFYNHHPRLLSVFPSDHWSATIVKRSNSIIVIGRSISCHFSHFLASFIVDLIHFQISQHLFQLSHHFKPGNRSIVYHDATVFDACLSCTYIRLGIGSFASTTITSTHKFLSVNYFSIPSLHVFPSFVLQSRFSLGFIEAFTLFFQQGFTSVQRAQEVFTAPE